MSDVTTETRQTMKTMVPGAYRSMPNWKEWSAPVQLELDGTGRYRKIRSVKQALQLLTNDWPETSSASYRNAVFMCDTSLKGETCPDDARRSFVDAGRKAGIAVKA